MTVKRVKGKGRGGEGVRGERGVHSGLLFVSPGIFTARALGECQLCVTGGGARSCGGTAATERDGREGSTGEGSVGEGPFSCKVGGEREGVWGGGRREVTYCHLHV